MPKFREKKVVKEVEAVQFSGTERSVIQIMQLQNDNVKAIRQDGVSLLVPCGSLKRRADKGDWIVKNENGELEICKEGIFEQTYEKV